MSWLTWEFGLCFLTLCKYLTVSEISYGQLAFLTYIDVAFSVTLS